jgi:calcineurin-like phosphoesterase family protein
MDEQLIKNWNDCVAPEDTVYHLGDIFLCPDEYANQIMNRLNGVVYLIRGNHDKTAWNIKQRFGWIKDTYTIRVDDVDARLGGVQEICCLHYAMRVWNKSHFGSWHCWGHSHGTLPDDRTALSMDVGVDAVAMRNGGRRKEDYHPISYDEVKKFMSKKDWKPLINDREQKD